MFEDDRAPRNVAGELTFSVQNTIFVSPAELAVRHEYEGPRHGMECQGCAVVWVQRPEGTCPRCMHLEFRLTTERLPRRAKLD